MDPGITRTAMVANITTMETAVLRTLHRMVWSTTSPSTPPPQQILQILLVNLITIPIMVDPSTITTDVFNISTKDKDKAKMLGRGHRELLDTLTKKANSNMDLLRREKMLEVTRMVLPDTQITSSSNMSMVLTVIKEVEDEQSDVNSDHDIGQRYDYEDGL